MRKKKNIRWNTVRILGIGFLALILFGAFLLWLPVCNQQPISFIDALFTSVTSVCVTGLTTVTPAEQFTWIGKIVILLLIQFGGLGVIACATVFFLLIGKQITMRESVVIGESYGMTTPEGVVDMVKRVLKGTLMVESFGALLYAVQFVPEFGFLRGIGYAVFHAVSAFCNAGIDILGDSSLTRYALNPLVNLTTMLLIIVSGIGFTVWFDVRRQIRRVLKNEIPRRRWFSGLRLHTKLAVWTTLVLIFGGALFFFLMEYHNPDTIGNLNTGQKIMASFFQSVTTRTAGFYTFSQNALHEESKLVCSILMFIGGSPGGTAGGVKTTTVALLFMACLTYIRGGHDTECMGRSITIENFRSGLCVMMAAFVSFLTGTVLILIIEPDSVPLVNVMFESASALGTVGLTADLTPHLSRLSQMIIMLMMYMGRLGPLTLALVFVGKSNPRDKIRQLPAERVMVG